MPDLTLEQEQQQQLTTTTITTTKDAVTTTDENSAAKKEDGGDFEKIPFDHVPFFGCVGNTPLIRLGQSLYGKLETTNPTGSIKDRVISGIVLKALKSGEIHRKSVLVEATSGNTGISLSAIGAAIGLPVKIFMPRNMSRARKQMMRKFGATLVEVGDNDFVGAVKLRDECLSDRTVSYWSPKQFSNPDNTRIHCDTTSAEIYNQVSGIDHSLEAVVTGCGTGGTITGLATYRREQSQNFKILLTEPTECAKTHGIQGIYDGEDFLMNRDEVDITWKVSTQEAKDKADWFAKNYGILVGTSAGANLLNAERYVKEYKPSGIVVAILCDRGERYLCDEMLS